jgi:cytochrome c
LFLKAMTMDQSKNRAIVMGDKAASTAEEGEVMRRDFYKFGLVLSLGALAFAAACKPAGSESASTTPPAAETTNTVAPAVDAPATNAVAAATNAVEPATNAVAAPTNAVAAATPAAGAVTLAVTDASGATLSGDPVKGEAVFRQCQTCHVKQVGVNKVGPSLAGIVGRPAGSIPGFRYSEANKNSGITWSEQELYVYLEDPKAKVPGTIMAFVGIKDSQKRADVIAYLKTPS